MKTATVLLIMAVLHVLVASICGAFALNPELLTQHKPLFFAVVSVISVISALMFSLYHFRAVQASKNLQSLSFETHRRQ